MIATSAARNRSVLVRGGPSFAVDSASGPSRPQSSWTRLASPAAASWATVVASLLATCSPITVLPFVLLVAAPTDSTVARTELADVGALTDPVAATGTTSTWSPAARPGGKPPA